MTLTAVLMAICAINIYLVFCFTSSRDEALKSMVRVEVCYHYELMHNATPLLSFGADTVVNSGCWYDSWSVIPSCRGRVIAISDVSKEKMKYRHLNAQQLLHNSADSIDRIYYDLGGQVNELKYYLRSHNVVDEGFEMVNRYAIKQEKEFNRIRALRDTLASIDSTMNLHIIYKVDYYVGYCNKSGKWTRKKAKWIKTLDAEGAQLLQTEDKTKPEGVKSQPKFLAIRLARMFSTTMRKNINFYERPDSSGIYAGATDENFVPNGHGSYYAKNGAYYEGHWKDGMRDGFGFSVGNHKRIRAGEWAHDVYQGERLNYTSERIYGIDISKYQHIIKKKRYAIDWKKLRITDLGTQSKKIITGKVNYPVSFIFIKSTEGTTMLNEYYKRDYEAAKAHGFRVGTYHFFSLTSSPVTQAKNFIKQSYFHKGDFPPVLDIEPLPSQIRRIGGDDELFYRIRIWLKLVEKATGVKPILYISQQFVNSHLNHAPDLKHNYRVWIARYGEYKPDVHLAIWQLCQDGKVDGIVGHVDINVFNGYKEEFNRFLKRNTIK